MGNHTPTKFMRTLRARLDHVTGRVTAIEASIKRGAHTPGSLNFYKAEREALEWAVRIGEQERGRAAYTVKLEEYVEKLRAALVVQDPYVLASGDLAGDEDRVAAKHQASLRDTVLEETQPIPQHLKYVLPPSGLEQDPDPGEPEAEQIPDPPDDVTP